MPLEIADHLLNQLFMLSYFQALIFWVVDNFLMNTLRINSSRTKSHKYSKLKTTADTEDRESIKLKSDGYNS